MRALVIGGTGFVGVATCKELMRRGIETIAASRRQHPYGTFTSHVAFDRRDPAQLEEALGRIDPDVLVDLAAYQPGEVEAALRLFRGQRYVFASTGVYRDREGGEAAREVDFVPPEGPLPTEELPYMEGKRWCEAVLSRHPEVNWISLRLPALYGAADPTLRIAAYLQRVEDGGPLLVPAETYDWRATLGWVKDAGFAVALAAEAPAEIRGAYNVGFRDLSLHRLLAGIAGAMGKELRAVPVPFTDLPQGSSPYGPAASPYGPNPRRPAGYDLTRSEADLGFRPSEPEDALAETLAWYRVARPSHPGYQDREDELRRARSLISRSADSI